MICDLEECKSIGGGGEVPFFVFRFLFSCVAGKNSPSWSLCGFFYVLLASSGAARMLSALMTVERGFDSPI